MHFSKSFCYSLNISAVPRIKAFFPAWDVEIWVSGCSLLIGSGSVVGLKDAKDLHKGFTPDLSLWLSRNMFKKEHLWHSAWLLLACLVCLSLQGAYKKPGAGCTFQVGASDSTNCDRSRMQLSDALCVLSTEIYPPLHTLGHGCRHSRTETSVMACVSPLAIEEPALHLYKAGKDLILSVYHTKIHLAQSTVLQVWFSFISITCTRNLSILSFQRNYNYWAEILLLTSKLMKLHISSCNEQKVGNEEHKRHFSWKDFDAEGSNSRSRLDCRKINGRICYQVTLSAKYFQDLTNACGCVEYLRALKKFSMNNSASHFLFCYSPFQKEKTGRSLQQSGMSAFEGRSPTGVK